MDRTINPIEMGYKAKGSISNRNPARGGVRIKIIEATVSIVPYVNPI
jgi:hypothetical protein